MDRLKEIVDGSWSFIGLCALAAGMGMLIGLSMAPLFAAVLSIALIMGGAFAVMSKV